MSNEENRVENAIIKRDILFAGKSPIPTYKTLTRVWLNFKTSYIENGIEIVLDDTKKSDRPWILIIGKDFALPIWEVMVKSMCEKEISRFEIDKKMLSSYPLVSCVYRMKKKTCLGNVLNNIALYKDLRKLQDNPKNLIFVFEIIKIEEPDYYVKNPIFLTDEEKITEISMVKKMGNDFFNKADYLQAQDHYLKALNILDSLTVKYVPNSEEYINSKNNYEIPLMLNMAQVTFKNKKYYDSINYCTNVLKIDKQNSKALFRRACSYLKIWCKDEAEKDFQQLLKHCPNMKNVVNENLKEFDVLTKEYEKKEKDKLLKKLSETGRKLI